MTSYDVTVHTGDHYQFYYITYHSSYKYDQWDSEIKDFNGNPIGAPI